MAQLFEMVAEKKMIDKKIVELRAVLRESQTDELATELVSLIDKRQSLLINIHRANISSSINIGGTSVDIATAILLRDSIKNKFDYLTELIDNPNCNLDKLELFSQRDRYFEEYVLIDMGIQKNDLQVTVS